MRGIKWLAAIPPTGVILGAFVANRVTPYVLGMPFLLFYIVAWVILTAPILAVVYHFDSDHHGGEKE